MVLFDGLHLLTRACLPCPRNHAKDDSHSDLRQCAGGSGSRRSGDIKLLIDADPTRIFSTLRAVTGVMTPYQKLSQVITLLEE